MPPLRGSRSAYSRKTAVLARPRSTSSREHAPDDGRQIATLSASPIRPLQVQQLKDGSWAYRTPRCSEPWTASLAKKREKKKKKLVAPLSRQTSLARVDDERQKKTNAPGGSTNGIRSTKGPTDSLPFAVQNTGRDASNAGQVCGGTLAARNKCGLYRSSRVRAAQPHSVLGGKVIKLA